MRLGPIPILFAVEAIVLSAGVDRADARDRVVFSRHRFWPGVCSAFSRLPCSPTVFCSVFHRGPCIPEIEYPIGQDLD